MARVTVVRPYGTTIRQPVFETLEALGCSIDPADIIPPSTSDHEAVEKTLSSGHPILLVPFHGHRDGRGTRIDGLSFLRKLLERDPDARFAVVMPVSTFGRAGLTLALENEADPTFDGRLLVIEPDQLKTANVRAELRHHLHL